MQAARYVVAATLVLGLAACGQDETTTSAEAESAQPVDLAGRTFESAQVSGITLADGTAVTLSFEDDGISASAGCNTMSGGANWDDGTLEIAGELATTMMACPEGLQEQEDWLGALLTSSPAIALDGDTLIVGDDTTGMVLEERANLPLEGTVWQLEELMSTSAVSAVAAGIAGLTIDATGTQVQVAAGCNTGSGSVTVEPADDASTGTIDFGPLAMTMKACPEDAMSVEAQVLTVLDGPVDYSIDGSTLTLTKGDAGLLFKGG